MGKNENNKSSNVSTPKLNPMSQINSPQMPTKEERDNGDKGYEVRSRENGR